MAAVYNSLSKPMGTKQPDRGNGNPQYRQRVLMLSSRGVTFRHRHLMNDLYGLLPHSRKDAKLDTKTKLYQLNELADLYNCNNIVFFEARKGKDLYVWMSKAPNGPTVKMHLQNLHTMEELHFSGNCLKGSRPILSFDATFDSQPHLGVIKELLTHIFGVPKGARKTKPFIDHVMGFTIIDGRIWIRCYQIQETASVKEGWAVNGTSKAEGGEIGDTPNDVSETGEGNDLSLIEIGPRFVLTPIVILESSFGGPVIYENREFVSPNQVRADMKRARAGKRNLRADKSAENTLRRGEMGLKSKGGRKKEKDPLDNDFLFS